MIRQCAVCGKDFDAKVHNAKYCPECRPAVYKEEKRQSSLLWHKNNPERHREKCYEWKRRNPERWAQIQAKSNAKRRAKYQLERKKARLRALMQANAVKRQAAQQRHKELYQGMAHWDKELPTTSIC